LRCGCGRPSRAGLMRARQRVGSSRLPLIVSSLFWLRSTSMVTHSFLCSVLRRPASCLLSCSAAAMKPSANHRLTLPVPRSRTARAARLVPPVDRLPRSLITTTPRLSARLTDLPLFCVSRWLGYFSKLNTEVSNWREGRSTACLRSFCWVPLRRFQAQEGFPL